MAIVQGRPIILTSGRPVYFANITASGAATPTFTCLIDSIRYENLIVQAIMRGAPSTSTTLSLQLNASLDGGTTFAPYGGPLSLDATDSAAGSISVIGLAGATLQLDAATLTLGTGATSVDLWLSIG